MQRMSVTEADRDFPALVDRVYSEGIVVELERADRVIARLSPATPESRLKVRDLNAFLESMPLLEDDAEAFDSEIRELRRHAPAETNPWE